MTKCADKLMRILEAGGGLMVDASDRSNADLLLLAKTSRKAGTILILKNTSGKSTDDLVEIVKAGEKGKIIIQDI